ncbi:MAG: hypothetical protein AAB359_07055 [Elusimicrobiota bacterium]
MDKQNKRFADLRRKFPAAELTAAGTLIALFSIFLGFYSSAITFAAQAYPELDAELIELIHKKIISELILTSITAVPLIGGLFYLLARRYTAITGGGFGFRE